MYDLRYALRMLRKRPGLSAAAILVLALGIAANGTIFALFNAVLLRPLTASDPTELVRIHGIFDNGTQQRISYQDYLDYRKSNTVFSELLGTTLVGASLRDGNGSSQIFCELVTENYFSVLEIVPTVGRTFLSEERNPVVVISPRLRQQRFQSDPAALGKTLNLNGQFFTVIGIAPESFHGTFAGAAIDAWIPVLQTNWLGTEALQNRETPMLHLIGRLKARVTMQQAQAALTSIARHLEIAYPQIDKRKAIEVVPGTLLHGSLRKGISLFLSALLVVVGLVLATACANVANLLLMSAFDRRREMAVRLALGAKRSRLIRQYLTETILSSLIGGTLGLMLSIWCAGLLMNFNPIPSVPIRFDLSFDWRVFSFLFLISVVTGILLGIAPALTSTRWEILPVLKNESGRTTQGRSNMRLRGLLIVFQVSITVVLLIGSALFLQSFRNAASLRTGFQIQNIFAIDIDLKPLSLSQQDGEQLYERLQREISRFPGVISVSFANLAPLDFSTPRVPAEIESEKKQISLNTVTPGYLETLGIRLLQGRDFDTHDSQEAKAVAIINQTMAKRFWYGKDPIGKRFRLVNDNSVVEIIGVTKDVKYRTLGEDPEPHMYLPFSQHYHSGMCMLVKVTTDPAGMLPDVEGELQKLAPGIEALFPRTILQHVGFSLLPSRMAATLSTVFAILALLLAMIGIYGSVGYSATQQTRDIGIRMALGAQRKDVLLLIMSKEMRPVLIGLGIGLAAAYGLTRLASSFLYGISPTDPVTFIGILLLLALMALLSSVLPARKALIVDPSVALRYD